MIAMLVNATLADENRMDMFWPKIKNRQVGMIIPRFGSLYYEIPVACRIVVSACP